MKRLIVVLSMLTVIAGLIVFEQIYTRITFREIRDSAVDFKSELSASDTENIDKEYFIEKSESFDRLWDKKKVILQTMYNQVILNDFEMKLSRLNAAITANEYPMALTELEQIYRSACEQLRQVRGSFSNIL